MTTSEPSRGDHLSLKLVAQREPSLTHLRLGPSSLPDGNAPASHSSLDAHDASCAARFSTVSWTARLCVHASGPHPPTQRDRTPLVRGAQEAEVHLQKEQFASFSPAQTPCLPHAFFVIVHRLEARRKHSLLSRDSAIIIAELCLFRNFNWKLSSFCSESSSRLNLCSQGVAFFFFHQKSLPVIGQFFPQQVIQVGQELLILLFSCHRGDSHANTLKVLHLLHGDYSPAKNSMLSIYGLSPGL